MKTIMLREIRERENDPATSRGAQHRIEAVHERIKPHYARINELGRMARNEKDIFKKFALLRELADFILAAMDGIAACSNGCSHCCHTPVLMTRVEAGVIAHETGRAVRNPKTYTRKRNDKYLGSPCPFLSGDSCSIYASRPFACRITFNMDKDALLCTLIKRETISVPYFNNIELHSLELSALDAADRPKIADIRDFFKPMEGGKDGTAD